MAFTKFNHDGGPVSFFPIMEGGMNCGYSITAYLSDSLTPLKSVSGTKDQINPLVFEDAGLIAEKTVVQITLQFRAGNNALENSPYTIGLFGKQDGIKLIANTTKVGKLPKLVKTSQLSLTLISAQTVTVLNQEQ